MKTDKQVISDLPDKIEMKAYCQLTKRQAATYERAVADLAKALDRSEGIQRRGIVLATLMRLKQICDHPALALGEGTYPAAQSGKFTRLAEICGELAEPAKGAGVYSIPRNDCALAEFLADVFGQTRLDAARANGGRQAQGAGRCVQSRGWTAVFRAITQGRWRGAESDRRVACDSLRSLVEPGCGKPGDRSAFRIGQRQNVFVHKFVCRGTIEERIDELIASKQGLAQELVEGGAEQALSEMDDEQLLRFVSLDIRRAVAS